MKIKMNQFYQKKMRFYNQVQMKKKTMKQKPIMQTQMINLTDL